MNTFLDPDSQRVTVEMSSEEANQVRDFLENDVVLSEHPIAFKMWEALEELP